MLVELARAQHFEDLQRIFGDLSSEYIDKCSWINDKQKKDARAKIKESQTRFAQTLRKNLSMGGRKRKQADLDGCTLSAFS